MFRNIAILIFSFFLLIACKSDQAATDTSKKKEVVNKKQATSPKSKGSIKVDRIYNFKEVDQPALFSANCSNDDNPQRCSQTKLREYIKANLKVPNDAKTKNVKEREVISFTVMPDGSIDDNIHSISKKEVCSGCRDAAIAVLANMNSWKPAMKDGKAVAMSVVAPVAFQ